MGVVIVPKLDPMFQRMVIDVRVKGIGDVVDDPRQLFERRNFGNLIWVAELISMLSFWPARVANYHQLTIFHHLPYPYDLDHQSRSTTSPLNLAVLQ